MKILIKFIAVAILGFSLAATSHAQSGRIPADYFGIQYDVTQLGTLLYNHPGKAEGWTTDIGAGFIRVAFPPFHNDTNLPWWDWVHDSIVEKFHDENDIEIMFYFQSNFYSTEAYADRENYLTAIYDRVYAHRGKVAFYHLGNEVDSTNRDNPAATKEAMRLWTEDVYNTIRAADPDAEIVMASLAGAIKYQYEYDFFLDMLDVGLNNFCDSYSVHTYPNMWGAQIDELPDLIQWFNDMKAASNVIDNKKIYITECGFLTSGPALHGNETEQAMFNMKRIIRVQALDMPSGFLPRINTYQMKDIAQKPDGAGLLRLDEDETPRKQYGAMKRSIQAMTGSIFMRERIYNDSVCYEFMKDNGQQNIVVWSTGLGRNQTFKIGSDSGYVYGIGGDNVLTIHDTTINFSYGDQPVWIITGDANIWNEGESYTSANWTPWLYDDDDSYNGKFVRLDTTAAHPSGYYFLRYTITVPESGYYKIFFASTPPNVTWASPYEYQIDGTGYVNLSGAVATGRSYGLSNAIRWLHADTRYIGAGSHVIDIRVNDTRSMDNRYALYFDAIYLEPN